MKKILTLVAALVCTLGALATEYTGQLTVKVNDDVARQEATVSLVDNGDGTYSFALKNFVLQAGTQSLGVGNIELPNLAGEEGFGFTNIATKQDVTITPGDDPNVSMWFGPNLGPVPVDLQASFDDTALSVNIDIDMVNVIGQMIKVSFVATQPQQGGSADVNGDKKVDIDDINVLINVILGKE